MGDMTQNLYLRPNDVITFGRAEKQVTISGAVERPGTYQLLFGENFKDLIDIYGDGFAPLVEPSRIELTRFVNGQDKVGNKIYLSEEAVEKDFPLI
jgi:protein involved in polysaccharide export with SLBB domain